MKKMIKKSGNPKRMTRIFQYSVFNVQYYNCLLSWLFHSE